MSMNTSDLNAVIAAKTGCTKIDVKVILEELAVQIKESVFLKDEEVGLNGLGKFFLRMSEERKVRNPRTGESLIVGARKHIRFKPFHTTVEEYKDEQPIKNADKTPLKTTTKAAIKASKAKASKAKGKSKVAA